MTWQERIGLSTGRPPALWIRVVRILVIAFVTFNVGVMILRHFLHPIVGP